MIQIKNFKLTMVCLVLIIFCHAVYSHETLDQATTNYTFNFKKYLFNEPSSLGIFVESLNKTTGHVTISGCDTRCPNIPFTWDWGDGKITNDWFPQAHTYADVSKNYIVTVISHYQNNETDSAKVLVRFNTPQINSIDLPEDIAVSIPSQMPTLTTRLYSLNSNLTTFDDTDFDVIPRSTIEYILSVAADIQMDLVNRDVYLIDGGFNQVMLQDSSFGGMYSLWFTNPVSFGVGSTGFHGTIGYSSFIHEMGHNFTLNTPADFYFGGRIDGSANAIFSETMAQIFQHTTGYELINNYQYYGLSDDILFDIQESFISSIKIVRYAYENYLNSGMAFSSWNDPASPDDETFNTFMTIAYQFFVHAENSELGYRKPLKRMMHLLQVFNEELRQQYDQYHNTAAADTFRATLMTTAVAYGFGENLCEKFKSLNFPISEKIYSELVSMINTAPIVAHSISDTNIVIGSNNYVRDLNAHPPVFNDADGDTLFYSANSSNLNVAAANIDESVLTVSPVSTGETTITVTTDDGQNAPVSTSFKITIIQSIGIKSLKKNIPTEYNLSQNFPNPFNPITKIKFALPTDTFVSLKVFDTMGQEIAALIDNKLQAGIHICEWNGENFASGLYLYRLSADNYTQTKKMLLLR